MYWPFNNLNGKQLLSTWLRKLTKLDIAEIIKLELEYEDPIPDLNPGMLLGESNQGMRGSGQTSPDLAVIFKTSSGEKGILLIESKFTEHSFYVCSGYQKKLKRHISQIPINQGVSTRRLSLLPTLKTVI